MVNAVPGEVEGLVVQLRQQLAQERMDSAALMESVRLSVSAVAAMHESFALAFRRLDEQDKELFAIREALQRAGVRL